MTGLEAAQKFKIEVNKLDRSSSIDLRVEKVLHYLNKAELFLIKKKYRGANIGPGRLEVMHPVLDDLKVLLKEQTYDFTVAIPPLVGGVSAFTIGSEDIRVIFDTSVHLYYISTRVKTKCADDEEEVGAWVEGRYIKPERLYKELQSPFTKTTYNSPVISVTDNSLVLYTEGFFPTDIKFNYLARPAQITQTSVIELPFEDEIIDTAITMALENFESERIKTQPQISTSNISE